MGTQRKLFLGMDCGGTSTRAVVADGFGQVVGIGNSGASNPNASNEQTSAARLAEAVASALARAGAVQQDLSAIFVGMAGIGDDGDLGWGRSVLARAGLGLDHVPTGLDHDIRIALAGGLPGEEGMALVAGTGASCYGRARDGRTARSGGWGPLLDDGGSACGLGYAAMRAAVRINDGRLPPSPLLAQVMSNLGLGRISEIVEKLYRKGMTPTEIARLAPLVIRAWQDGDGVATQLVLEGVNELVLLVKSVKEQLGFSEAAVCFCGGLIENADGYREAVHQGIRSRLAGVKVASTALPPVLGAVLLAYDLGNHAHDARVWDQLKVSFNAFSGS
jgi:N-acetylglucosamine kinase-like BadF-type ATPase